MYEGVETHGVLHRLRMEDVFWTRTMSLLKFAELMIVSTLPTGAGDERIQRTLRAYREFTETMLPHQTELRKAREAHLQSMMSDPEFMKPISVRAVEEK